MAKPKKVTYRNKIEQLLGIYPSDVKDFETKKHSRTRPAILKQKRKAAKLARRVNRGR